MLPKTTKGNVLTKKESVFTFSFMVTATVSSQLHHCHVIVPALLKVTGDVCIQIDLLSPFLFSIEKGHLMLAVRCG